MARKTTTGKKTGKNKQSSEKPTVDSIIADCTVEVRRGLDGKTVLTEAREHWIRIYTKSIGEALGKGINWEGTTRARVLKTAYKLGTVSVALTGSGSIPLWVAEAAAVAVKKDPGCPVIGSGSFCASV